MVRIKAVASVFKILANFILHRNFESLLLSSCVCYWVDLDCIQWNEVTILTARDFNQNWPLYLIFSNMINLCPDI